ncbi:hypothetical protein [Escherichia coli]|uniref:hypothetical protein n=1 Tax=Escherichia coli TaxID=562 RepID=UPI001CDAA74D|nr:hypothetical protein [Escherichia coli]WEN22585.1 hypothetical protein KFZ60_15920 [Escherichia coli]WEN31935.1 hypothetical protein KFZ54_15910 [Escherichia coli]
MTVNKGWKYRASFSGVTSRCTSVRWHLYCRVTGHHTDSGEQYRLAWDLAQRRLCVTDGLGRTRYHQWDAQNQVTAYQDEAGQVMTFRWSDEERLLLGMTDAQGGKRARTGYCIFTRM